MAGGAQEKVPVYTTEGGWLQLAAEELVEEALQAKERGFRGVKVKVGKPTVAEDAARVAAVRDALGPELELMVDANQGLALDQALRRARALKPDDANACFLLGRTLQRAGRPSEAAEALRLASELNRRYRQQLQEAVSGPDR